ncbi:MAG TPA: ABC transporter permease, partial [Gemmataceae bacterium]|nr:ABC transporter permease [Gemmataceae bacterium]
MFLDFYLSPRLLAALAAGLGLVVVLVLAGKIPLGYNVRNLLVRWPITLLTALAFTLVVFLLTGMLAFVNGMARITEASGQPGNVMILSEGATDELFSTLVYSDMGNVDRQPGILTDERGRPLSSREVYIVVNQPISTQQGESGRRRFVQLRGVEDALTSSRVHGMELFPPGKWFSDAGVDAKKTSSGQPLIQAVLGEGVARILGQDRHKEQLEIDDEFELGPRKWIVTGIMKSAGSSFGSEMWAKRSIVGPMFGKEQLTCIVVSTQHGETAQTVAEDLRTNYKPAVRAEPETEYYSKLSETNKQFSGAIYFITIIMAIGGVFGVMNTMFAAIS